MIMGEGVSTGAWVKEKVPRLLGLGRMGGRWFYLLLLHKQGHEMPPS